MAMSEAHKRASNKFLKKMLDNGNYKKLGLTIKGDVYQMIDDYSKLTNISKAQLITDAVKEYIEKHPAEQEISKE